MRTARFNNNLLSAREPKRVDDYEATMREIAQVYTEFPLYGTRISLDGKGYWMDNLFIERLSRRL